MDKMLFFLGLGITLILVFSYCLVVWRNEKRKLFKEQLGEAFKNALNIQQEMVKPMMKITEDFKKESEKRFLQDKLEFEKKTEKKLKNTDQETLKRLMDTGLTKDEAIKYLIKK
jgi:hypothetical protein